MTSNSGAITGNNDNRWTRREALGLLGIGAAALSQQSALGAKAPTFPKGAIIRTVTKDVSPESITGSILFHEHLSIDYGHERALKLPPPSQIDIRPVIEDLKAAAKAGVQVVVDGGHPDMGRSLAQLKQEANGSPVLIVASGGYYMETNYPAEIGEWSEDQIADELVRQANADNLGAFGEIGQMPNTFSLSEQEEKVFRGVAKAHLRTNLPIFTHNAYGTGPDVPRHAGLLQLDVLESAGVSPDRIVIGHLGSLDEPSAFMAIQIAKRGAFVGFDRLEPGPPGIQDSQMNTVDRIAREKGTGTKTGTGKKKSDPARESERQVNEVVAVINAGYADKVMLSHDHRKYFTGIAAQFVPKLRAAGVKDDVIHQIMVDNPRRWLAFVPKAKRSAA